MLDLDILVQELNSCVKEHYKTRIIYGITLCCILPHVYHKQTITEMCISKYEIYFRFMELLVLSMSNSLNGSRQTKDSSPPLTPQESLPPPDMIRSLEELFADKNLVPQPGVVACDQLQPQQQQQHHQRHHHHHHQHHNGIQMQVM